MADPAVDPREQASIVMPNGVTMTGIGGDPDAMREQFEQRHQERTGEAVEATVEEPLSPAEPEQRPTRGRKRFSELTGERDAALAKAAAAEQRAKDAEERLRTSAVRTEESLRPKQADAAPVVAQPTRQKPAATDIGTKYQGIEDYLEDLSDWKLEQREAKLRADFDARLNAGIEADRASRTRTSHVNDVFTRGRAQFADFDAVLKTADTFDLSPLHQEAILSLPNPEQVMYALGKDHDQLKRIQGITNPVQLGVALAQVMPRTEAVAHSPASTPVAVRTTNAPAPPQPVGAGSRTAQPSLEQLARDGNYEAYKARREADRKRA